MTDSPRSMSHKDGIDLRDYFEAQIKDLRRYYDSKLEGIEHGTSSTAQQLEKRLNGMNEFRESLKDSQARMVSRQELDFVLDKLNIINQQIANCVTRDSCAVHMGRASDDIRILREAKAAIEGKASLNAFYVTLLISLIGLVLSLIGIIQRFA